MRTQHLQAFETLPWSPFWSAPVVGNCQAYYLDACGSTGDTPTNINTWDFARRGLAGPQQRPTKDSPDHEAPSSSSATTPSPTARRLPSSILTKGLGPRLAWHAAIRILCTVSTKTDIDANTRHRQREPTLGTLGETCMNGVSYLKKKKQIQASNRKSRQTKRNGNHYKVVLDKRAIHSLFVRIYGCTPMALRRTYGYLTALAVTSVDRPGLRNGMLGGGMACVRNYESRTTLATNSTPPFHEKLSYHGSEVACRHAWAGRRGCLPNSSFPFLWDLGLFSSRGVQRRRDDGAVIHHLLHSYQYSASYLSHIGKLTDRIPFFCRMTDTAAIRVGEIYNRTSPWDIGCLSYLAWDGSFHAHGHGKTKHRDGLARSLQLPTGSLHWKDEQLCPRRCWRVLRDNCAQSGISSDAIIGGAGPGRSQQHIL
ncbi:uncharacterized protein CLUP02_10111 [Colletotrichum lupini]|uniref:Uncharacterized protein n=1 Tax=Colletotrichum lupini TaxID=145971 RepID=A0A9Q8SW03_9PEZI|nr:uncharacterized protein CLUP02_10111 [Colletotrichum lupini]UQC84614.1 hypothetical protein CLUP02_10111 [Colletotrichum lupini]